MIPLSSTTIERFTPPAIEKREPKVVIHFSVPTLFDRDIVNARLFELGVVPVKATYIRGSFIDELFNLHPVEKAEELAAEFEAGWAETALHETMVLEWGERERERIRDQLAGAPPRDPEPVPKSGMPVRARARLDTLFEETTNASERLRKLTAQSSTYEARQRLMIARLHIVGWDGIEVTPVFDDVADHTLLDEAVTLKLRAEVGEVAWGQILNYAYSLYDLTREEVGNSASPPEQPSHRNGSKGRSGGSATRNGASTKPKAMTTRKARSNTAPAPSAASRKTTAKS